MPSRELDVFLVCALLRAVDGGGTVGPMEGIGDVGCQNDHSVGDSGIETGQVRMFQVQQAHSSRVEGGACAVFQRDAEGLKHAGTAVRAGASAEADDDAVCAGVELPVAYVGYGQLNDADSGR